MKWEIPLFDADYGKEEQDAVKNVLQSGWLTMGPETEAFEAEFANYIGCRYAIAVNNCTAALHMAHKALGALEGDEVICPSLTFVASANSIKYTGASVVFADIVGPENFNLAAESIVSLITENTKGICVVHYAGYPCDMESISKIAARNSLYIVEDCAHAPGATLAGRKLGSLGDIGCFSFFSNKNLSTGEGGMLTTNSEELSKKLKLYRSHGMTTLTLDRHKGHAFSYDVVEAGFNYRIDEIKSAIGRVQLKKLDAKNAQRAKLTGIYQDLLANISGIHVPFSKGTGTSSNHIMPILLPFECNRESVMKSMAEQGVQTSIHYPPIHQFTHYAPSHPAQQLNLKQTELISQAELTLPLYPNMTEAGVEKVIDALKGAING